MNISPTPVTIYKGMKLATATPEHCIFLVSHTDSTDKCPAQSSLLDQIDLSHLAPEKQSELTTLLNDFSDVFCHGNIPMKHTSIVKHSIPITEHSICQLLRRIPQALKSIVSNEVDCMLDHNIIHPSSSPWSSPVVMMRKKTVPGISVLTSLHHTILQKLHNELGHLSFHKTMERVKQRYYWPVYKLDVQKWIAECASCQQCDAPQPTSKAPLGTITAKHLFDVLPWDIMGPLPVISQGNKYVLVVTNLFSKWTEAFPQMYRQ